MKAIMIIGQRGQKHHKHTEFSRQCKLPSLIHNTSISNLLLPLFLIYRHRLHGITMVIRGRVSTRRSAIAANGNVGVVATSAASHDPQWESRQHSQISDFQTTSKQLQI